MSIIPSRRRSNIYDPFCLDIWDPFHDFPFPIPSSASDAFWEACSALVNIRVDWKETHIFKDDLPAGIKKKEEVVLEVEDNDNERYVEREDKNKNKNDNTSGKLKRRFRLPLPDYNAKLEHVKDSMENGVLTIIVQKEEVKKPVQISG